MSYISIIRCRDTQKTRPQKSRVCQNTRQRIRLDPSLRFLLSWQLLWQETTVYKVTKDNGESSLSNAPNDLVEEYEDDHKDQYGRDIPHYRELFSVSTRDRKYFFVWWDGERAYNPNLIPHPTLADKWIVVAQKEQYDEDITVSAQLVCTAGFVFGALMCDEHPTELPVAPSITGNCQGDLAYANFRTGPRDGRMFHGPLEPFVMWGSQSAYACFELWLQDARMLLEPFHLEQRRVGLFRDAMELKRPEPWHVIEKNFFLFWDAQGMAYVHFDLWPKRVFAQLNYDGGAGSDLAPAAAGIDARYPRCIPNDDNNYIIHMFHWKSFYDFHGGYEPYVVLFKRSAPFAMHRAECGLIFYIIYIVDGWYCALFRIGILLCDVDLLAIKHQLPRRLHWLRSQPPWVYDTMLLIALYVGGVTSLHDDIKDLRQTPGWYLLSFLPPQAMLNYVWFYRIIAATLLMICIPRIRWLQAFFETCFCQYLGRISFGLYLIHGPLLWTIGDRVYAAVGLVREAHHGLVPWWVNRYPFPSKGPYGLEFNFLAAQLILLPFNLWAAEMFTQFVDEPSVKFAQWLLKHHISIDRGFMV